MMVILFDEHTSIVVDFHFNRAPSFFFAFLDNLLHETGSKF